MSRSPVRISFPFERGHHYKIGELRAFEADLRGARNRDRELGKLLRNPNGPAAAWMRLRNKELIPLKLFADHTGIPDYDVFLLSPEGDPVDAKIVTGGRTLNLQLTLAAPIWGERSGAQENSGYQYHQIMAALNDSDCVSGYPPFVLQNGIAMGETVAATAEDRDKACQRGLSSAIANKASHDGRGCILAVFARDFYMHILDVKLLGTLLDRALDQQSLSFDSVCVFDSEASFFVRRPLQVSPAI